MVTIKYLKMQDKFIKGPYRKDREFSIVTPTETQECGACSGVRRIRLRGLEAAGVA